MTLNPNESQQLQSLSQTVTTLGNTVDTLLALIQQSGGQGGDIAAHNVDQAAHDERFKQFLKDASTSIHIIGGDLNDYVGQSSAGWYDCDGSAGPANRPLVANGFILVLADEYNLITKQFFFYRASGASTFWSRVHIGSTNVWTDWVAFKGSDFNNTVNGYPLINASYGLSLGRYASTSPIKGVVVNNSGLKMVDRSVAGASIGLFRVADGANNVPGLFFGKTNGADALNPIANNVGDYLATMAFCGINNANAANNVMGIFGDIYAGLASSADLDTVCPRTYIRFRLGDNGTGLLGTLFMHSTQLQPGQDNFYTLGYPSARFKDIHMGGILNNAPIASYTWPYSAGMRNMGTDLSTARISTGIISNDTTGSRFYLSKARGTPAAPLPVQAGDDVGGVFFGTPLTSSGAYSDVANMRYRLSGSATPGQGSIPAGYFHFQGGNNGPSQENFFYIDALGIHPGVDNIRSCGRASIRFSVVYAATGAINTSDENVKQNIASLLDDKNFLRAWLKRVDPKVFQYNDSVETKGHKKARKHIGVLAQNLLLAFSDVGLDAHDYGVFCEDLIPDEYREEKVIDVPGVSEWQELPIKATRIVEKDILIEEEIKAFREVEILDDEGNVTNTYQEEYVETPAKWGKQQEEEEYETGEYEKRLVVTQEEQYHTEQVLVKKAYTLLGVRYDQVAIINHAACLLLIEDEKMANEEKYNKLEKELDEIKSQLADLIRN